MSLLLAMLFAGAAGAEPEIIVKKAKPKMVCERVHEVGSIRSRRVCVPAEQAEAAARARRLNADQIRDQSDREKQLVQDNMGDKPL